MKRSLIWTEGNATGWSCSNWQWRFVLPTQLSGEKAIGTYDRLAAAKFHEHTCEPPVTGSATATKHDANSSFIDRARMLILRGYKPKDAVELVLQEMAIEWGSHSETMEKVRAAAEEFLSRIRLGLI
ncbi:MAG: hypothetical protein ABSE28_03845 [Candidatus Sulfotelmatobacter sp.]|jgi:hypothetical protein